MKPVRSVAIICLIMVTAHAATPAVAQQEGGTGTNYETRLMSLEENMRTLNGQMEQILFNLRRIDQTMQRLQSDTDGRLTRLEQLAQQQQAASPAVVVPSAMQTLPPQTSTTVNMPSNTVTSPPSNPTAETDVPPIAPVDGTLGTIKSQNGHMTSIVNPKTPPLPPTPGDYGLTVQEQYDRAFDFLRKANYDEAENAFKTFVDKNPKDKLIDNAKYWYGETLYVRGRYDDSAVAFADAYQQNPRGTKAPDSLLKLAMSLGALNKVPDACATLAELKGKYPTASSNVRTLADQERSKFKCGAT
jgi:tol-pal system protein YbgF